MWLIDKILFYVLTGLLFVLIIDPSDLIFRLKIPLFGLSIIIWGMKCILEKKIQLNKILIVVFAFLISLSVYGVLISFSDFPNIDLSFGLGFIKSILIFLIIFPIISISYSLEKNFYLISLLIPCITLVAYIISIYNLAYFDKIYSWFVLEKKVAIFSIREFFGLPFVSLFYKTCPLLVFPLAYYYVEFLKKRKIKTFGIVLLFALCLFLSGTRANLLSIVIILFAIPVLRINNPLIKYSLMTSFLVGIVLIGAALMYFSLQEQEMSAEVKSGHLKSILSVFIVNPHTLIFGQGIGSYYFSEGVQDFIVQSELSFFEILRMLGLGWTILFIGVYLYPILNMVKRKGNESFIIAYLCYLFIAGTNPLLISSTGVFALVYAYFYINESSLRTKL